MVCFIYSPVVSGAEFCCNCDAVEPTEDRDGAAGYVCVVTSYTRAPTNSTRLPSRDEVLLHSRLGYGTNL